MAAFPWNKGKKIGPKAPRWEQTILSQITPEISACVRSRSTDDELDRHKHTGGQFLCALHPRCRQPSGLSFHGSSPSSQGKFFVQEAFPSLHSPFPPFSPPRIPPPSPLSHASPSHTFRPHFPSSSPFPSSSSHSSLLLLPH